MQNPSSSRSRRSPFPYFLLLALLGAAIGLAWAWPSQAPSAPPPDVPDQRTQLAPLVQVQRADAEAPPQRERLAPSEPAEPPAPPRTFEERVHELCAFAQRAGELARDDEIEAAEAADRGVRARFTELLDDYPDAGHRSLAVLLTFPDPAPPAERRPGGPLAPEASGDGTASGSRYASGSLDARIGGAPIHELEPPRIDHVLRTVLQMVLAADLQRRHDLASKVDDFARCDELVQATLDSMPAHSLVADVGTSALARRPFLRLTHEPGVLALVRLANEGSFSREFATRLLTTLWDNLQRSGERSSEEMSLLALLYLDDSDPSQAIAACRQLLADPNYRELVFARLRERGDRRLATEVARMVAHEMAPEEALRALQELHPLIEHAGGLYLGVGVRSPDTLADGYHELLAHDNRPEVRRDLILGIGMQPNGRGLQTAELALQNDPSPQVRIQALFALSVHADPTRAEQAFEQLLDDPAITGVPEHLGSLVVALQNLEHGDVNVVARLGRRLRMHALADYSADLLEQILARSTPGGAPADTPAGG